MAIEPTEIAGDTDDLEAFEKLFMGTKAPEKVTEPEEIEQDDTPVETEIPEDKTPEDKPDEEVNKEEKPKKNPVQERINKLVTERENERRRVQELEAKLAELQKQPEKPAVVPPAQYDGPKPDDKLDDGSDKYPLGEFDPQYIRDMARHTIDKEWTTRKEQEAKETAQKQEQAQRDALQSQWSEKMNTFSTEVDDFFDKTVELEETFGGLDPQYADYLVQTIKTLDHGPQVLYYFANHLDEAQKFVKMGALPATLALGEINAMFRGNTRQETKVSKAPPPPQVNKGTKATQVVAADTDDLDAFSKLFYKKRR
jgi:hypothetical protein